MSDYQKLLEKYNELLNEKSDILILKKEIRKVKEINKKLRKDNIELSLLVKVSKEINAEPYKIKKAIDDLIEGNERLNNIINELEEYIKQFLYMLNGITDRDVYEQCQLDDFTMIMEKLQEIKGE